MIPVADGFNEGLLCISLEIEYNSEHANDYVRRWRLFQNKYMNDAEYGKIEEHFGALVLKRCSHNMFTFIDGMSKSKKLKRLTQKTMDDMLVINGRSILW